MFRLLSLSVILLLASESPQIILAQQVNRSSQPVDVRSENALRDDIKARSARSEAKKLYHSGEKYGRAGLFIQAAQAFQLAVKLDPDYGDAHLGLGHAYVDLHRWNEAVQALETALRLKPNDKQALSLLAEAKLAKERETPHPAGEAVGARVAMDVRSNPPKTPEPAVTSNVALTSVYRIGPGDVLDIRFGQKVTDNSSLYTVTSSGLLEHPNLASPLKVAGLTVDEVSGALAVDLKRQMLSDDPHVIVAVREYASHNILVSGLVREPGTKIIRREAIPLYVVVADAQPLPEAARANVIRRDSHQQYIVDLMDSDQMNLLVYPGDVVTLQPSIAQYFYVGGEVKEPGEKTFRRGLTLTQAIIAAGGVSQKGSRARVGRENEHGFLSFATYKLKDIESGHVADPEVHAGDRITIEH